MFWQIKNTLKQKEPRDRLKELEEFLLESRGLTDKKSIDAFLQPKAPDLDIIDQLPDLDKEVFAKALEYIRSAAKDKRPIIIFGDYDCDGVVASAILWEAIYSLTPSVKPFIPSRTEHGYGLSREGLLEALKLFPGEKPLVITVDNGITAHDVVTEFSDVDIIITDHHQKGDQIPPAKFLIHTTKISGAGVAWVVASHLVGAPQPLDLLAMATVCDLLPLVGPNRSFVKYGLKQLETTTRPGMVALKKLSGIPDGPLDTYHLGFVLGPRINAAGRLGQGMDALRLLCTKNTAQAQNLAELLNETNSDRQFLTQKHTKDALRQVNSLDALPDVIVLDSTDYHEGIIGLIAGKVVEEFHRPCIVLAVQGEHIKGSARSPEGIDITAILRTAGEGLIECGGHMQAAGLKMDLKNLEEFKTKIVNVSKDIDPKFFEKHLEIDARLESQDLSFELLEILSRFAPFGVQNPHPSFAGVFSKLKMRLVGKGQNHLSMELKSDKNKLSAIGFNLGRMYEEVESSFDIDIAFHLEKNSYMGRDSLQLQIKDLKPLKTL
jgi:single-stranded-DNA-specific exonuclease